MLCLFGDTEVAHDLGEKFPIVGYIFYYIHMIASFLLLLNMLLAIIVEAYIHVKQEASAADNVFVDMYKQVGGSSFDITMQAHRVTRSYVPMCPQAKAGLRATQRPKDILSITAVIEKTAHWLRPDPPQPAGAGVSCGRGHFRNIALIASFINILIVTQNPSIELEGEFKATEEDLQRVCRCSFRHHNHGVGDCQCVNAGASSLSCTRGCQTKIIRFRSERANSFFQSGLDN